MATTTATVTTTVLSTIVSTVTSATATPTPKNRATPQSGILEGINPIIYNASNPISLFIVQAAIIIIFCRLLAYPLRYLGQPRVIAEVIGGILLGPSVFMRIPGFKDNIFPTASMPVLNNVANLGLILFLFLTGLEVRSYSKSPAYSSYRSHSLLVHGHPREITNAVVCDRSTCGSSKTIGKWH